MARTYSAHSFGSDAKVQQALSDGNLQEYDLCFLDEGRIAWVNRDNKLTYADGGTIKIVSALPVTGQKDRLYIYNKKAYIYDKDNNEWIILYPDIPDVTPLQTDIDAVETNVSVLDTRLTTLQSNTYTKTETDNLVSNLQVDISDCNNSLDTKLVPSNITVGTVNGTIRVSSKNVPVKGLNNAAYKYVATAIEEGNTDLPTSETVYNHVASTIANALNTKVDKIPGKELSDNNFTNAYKSKIDSTTAKADTALQEGDVVTGSVNGTIKVKGNDVIVKGLTDSAYKLISSTVYPDSDEFVTGGVINDFVLNITDNKVDKEDGKQLSTNDFTDEYKEKIDNLNITASNLLTGDNITTGTSNGYIAVNGHNIAVKGLQNAAYSSIAKTIVDANSSKLPTVGACTDYFASKTYANDYDFAFDGVNFNIEKPDGVVKAVNIGGAFSNATPTSAGFMSASDKNKLDKMNEVFNSTATHSSIVVGNLYGLTNPCQTLTAGQDYVVVEYLISGIDIAGCIAHARIWAYGNIVKEVNLYIPPVGSITEFPLYVMYYPEYGSYGMYDCDISFASGIGTSSVRINMNVIKMV